MNMYRAVAKTGFKPGEKYMRRETPRLPKNVPYFVDNIWEWLRPDQAPSRQHAVYASATPELALFNASSAGASRDEYLVCELELHGQGWKVAYLQVSDARLHGDIQRLRELLRGEMGIDQSTPTEENSPFAALFKPGINRSELDQFFNADTRLHQLTSRIREASRFWHEASLSIQSESSGEMFFEVPADGHYLLRPLTLPEISSDYS